MGWTDRLAKVFLNQSTVVHKNNIAEQAIRLSVQSDGLKKVPYTPGNHLRVFVGMDTDQRLGDKVRTYSIWQLDRTTGVADLAICMHSDGPGSTWAEAVKEGDTLYFSKPTGKFVLDESADHYFFIGDASALGHLYEIRRHLPVGKSFDSIIYATNKRQLFPDIDNSTPFDFYEFANNPINEIRAILDDRIKAEQKTICYVGGDGRLCVALNRYLRQEKGLASKAVKTKPFWLPHKKGLE